MGKKKSAENVSGEQMLLLQKLQGQGCKQVLVSGAQGGHPHDQASLNRKKKSLLEVIGPAEVGGNFQKSKKRGYAAAAEGSRRQQKKIHNYVGDVATGSCAVSRNMEELSDEPLVRRRSILTNLNNAVPANNDEFLGEPCLENVLNSTCYGQEVGCEAVDEPFGNCSKEDLEHLLALLPPCERNIFINSHPNFSFANPTINVHQSTLVSEVEFNEKVQELDMKEKKFKKKQAKKQAAKIPRIEDGLPGSNPVTLGLQGLKPPVTPAKFTSAAAGSRLESKIMEKKKDCSRTVVSNQDPRADLRSWGTLKEIPAFEVNSLAMPVGEFMEHMRQYAFQQAYLEFPWHKDWNKQCPQLKARFLLNLGKVYPSPWEAKTILQAIGGNLRERRTRLKRSFQRSKNPKLVAQPAGCSEKSWKIIYESTQDANKQRKAKLCKEATTKRLNSQGCNHRCGPRGVKGLFNRFVESFHQPPSNEELDYGKVNGWAALRRKTENSKKMLDTSNFKEDMSIPIGSAISSSSCDTSSDSSTDDDGDTSTFNSEKENICI